eukprot:TRINITY_DN483_c0_g1_i11.p1 TRINITY_DN483_c0_g1~~TRINITY_DN483_c0_g1_i11.p1  ORF type:complete len:249 (+),score=14.13 TRINITY_DN483_c0_g1_i11:166-912(+)
MRWVQMAGTAYGDRCCRCDQLARGWPKARQPLISGYIKLWRETLEHEVFQDPDLWRLWCWCLMSASYLPTTWHGESLAAGEFITGRHSAAQQLHISPSKWVRGIERLKDLGCISTRANSKWTTISICNWSTYQADVASDRTTSGQPAANSQQQFAPYSNSGQQSDNTNRNLTNSLQHDADNNSNSQRTAGDTANGQPADTDKEFKNLRIEERKSLKPPNPLSGGTGGREIGRAVQQECRDRSRMPSSA